MACPHLPSALFLTYRPKKTGIWVAYMSTPFCCTHNVPTSDHHVWNALFKSNYIFNNWGLLALAAQPSCVAVLRNMLHVTKPSVLPGQVRLFLIVFTNSPFHYVGENNKSQYVGWHRGAGWSSTTLLKLVEHQRYVTMEHQLCLRAPRAHGRDDRAIKLIDKAERLLERCCDGAGLDGALECANGSVYHLLHHPLSIVLPSATRQSSPGDICIHSTGWGNISTHSFHFTSVFSCGTKGRSCLLW